jgi:1-deoxy-D-xylulose 5-phosphate reductoisomerase
MEILYEENMKYKSEVMEAAHEQAVEMFKTGEITETRMREYDEMCLKNNKTNKRDSTVSDDGSSSSLKIANPAIV